MSVVDEMEAMELGAGMRKIRKRETWSKYLHIGIFQKMGTWCENQQIQELKTDSRNRWSNMQQKGGQGNRNITCSLEGEGNRGSVVARPEPTKRGVARRRWRAGWPTARRRKRRGRGWRRGGDGGGVGVGEGIVGSSEGFAKGDTTGTPPI
uniref:Uncharacterized protein n=1 Tax=Oryza glumipatula TaxID=40148 RepID=A0A0D9ZVJ4_9ORYZ